MSEEDPPRLQCSSTADDEVAALLGGTKFDRAIASRAALAAGPVHAAAGLSVETDAHESREPRLSPAAFPNLNRFMHGAPASGIDLLRDVNLEVKVELGRSRMLVEEVLKLVEGSVVELDKLAGDPVEIFVNERLVARGEVLVLNDNFCVRVKEIIEATPEEDL